MNFLTPQWVQKKKKNLTTQQLSGLGEILTALSGDGDFCLFFKPSVQPEGTRQGDKKEGA